MPRYSISIRVEYDDVNDNDAGYTAQEAEEAIKAAVPNAYVKVWDVENVPHPKREGE